MKALKEQWFSPNSPDITVHQYITKLRDKLQKLRDFAQANLTRHQDQSKERYDLKTTPRSFSPGELVLVFLPLTGSPLKCKYSGPYQIKEKLSPLNYIISTPDRRKKTQLAHINLIKPYLSRNSDGESSSGRPVPVCITEVDSEAVMNPSDPEEVDEGELPMDLPSSTSTLSNSQILQDLDKYFSGLHPSQISDMIELLSKFPTVTSDTPGLCHLIPHDILLVSDAHPIRQTAYRLNPQKRSIMKKEVQYLLDNNLAEPSQSPWASPCLLVPKQDNSFRLCTDYRKVNQVTVRDSYPLPLIEDLLDNVGNAKFISTMDLTKGYYQIPLTDRAKTISAFITPFGLYQYTVLPFGMTNAPSTFQRVINTVIRDLPGTWAYLDDVVVVADDWGEHVARLNLLLHRLKEACLTINLKKSAFGRGTVTYLGHVVGGGMVKPKEANINAVLAFPPPKTRREVMRFLGMVGYYRRFCSNFSSVAAPLSDLTSPAVPFRWTPACEKAFEQLKGFLSAEPVLRSPDFRQPFHLQVDASGVGVGAVLLQPSEGSGTLHPVAYFSAKLKDHQVNYSTIEKESLALILALKKFECYLQPSPNPIQVFTDHNPLSFINTMKKSNPRILRWSLTLQPFHLKISHIKGTDNLIAEALSCAPVE